MDVSDLTGAATSTPEQAATNIQNATIMSMDPTSDKSVNDQIAPQVDQVLRPTVASPAVADYMSQSTEHAALAMGKDPSDPSKSDLPMHSFVDDTTKYIGDIIYNRPTDNAKMISLYNKKADAGGTLSDEDSGALWQLEQNSKIKPTLGPNETPPSWPVQFAKTVGGSVLDMGRTVRKNADLIATTTALGAGAGLLGGPLAEVTVPGGAIAGFNVGLAASFATDAYDSTRGSVYGMLDNMTGDDGKLLKIDERTKANTAYGAGLVSAALMGINGSLIAKAVPFLNPALTPALAKTAMLAPENAVMRITLQRIGHTMLTMGGVGALQQATGIFAKEFGKHFDGTPGSISDALVASADSLDNWAQVGQAALTNATVGGVVAGVAGVTGIKQTRAQVDALGDTTASGFSDYVRSRRGGERDVTPGAPEQLNAGTTASERDVTPPTPQSPSPENSIQKSVKVLQFEDAMNDVTEAQKQTKMNDHSPAEMASMTQKIFDRAGISKLYATFDSLRQWATSEEKGRAARNAIDPSGVLAGQNNAPFEVDPVKIAAMAHDDPSIWGQVKLDPDGPTAVQAKTHLENVQKAVEKRGQLMQSLGIEPKDIPPAEENNIVPIGSKVNEPFDFEAHVAQTQSILDQLQSPDVNEKQKTTLNKQLSDIKSKVANAMSTHPGDLLIPQFGAWPEPNADASNKLASDYINEPTFTEAIQKVLPKAEVQKFNIAQQNARKSVVDSIKDSAIHEMNQVQDVMAEIAKDERNEAERARIADDPNYAVVDKVRAANKVAHSSKSTSIYAINPRTLTKEQAKFADNFRLKEHKVFDKNGHPADDVAALLGLRSGSELLDVLSKTPTREQVAKARAAANALADQESARESVDLNHTRIIEDLRAETANHIAEMKFMREQEWPATKQGIKRIALPLPHIEELTQRAKGQIAQTRVGSLNSNQFRVGERQSKRLAVNSILRNEVAQAFQAKEAAALNSELEKETYLATARVNRALTFMRRLNRASSRAVLRQGGKQSVAAMKELTDLINFRQTKAPKLPIGIQEGPVGDYLKWATAEVKSGRGDFSIPDRLTDIRQSYKDMTVEQLLVIVDRARVIFNEAKFKGQLIQNDVSAQNAEAEYNVDRIAEKIVSLTNTHPGRNEGNLKPVQGERRGWNKIRFSLATPEELLAAKQNIIRELDRGQTGGYFHKILDEAFEGSGPHHEKSGFSYLKKVNKWIDASITQINNAHGDVNSLEGKFLNIPEFKDIKELSGGILTKGDLLAAMANRGQQYTKDMLFQNTGGVSDATWQKVLDRELEPKDVQHMQSVVDLYKHKTIRDKTTELQARDGREVDFIEGIPFVHRGIVYPGGYIRVRTVHEYTAADVKKVLAVSEGKGAAYYEKDEGAKWAEQYAAQTTHQGYLVSRTSNTEPISLKYSGIFDGLREIAHDHAYREPLRNFFSIMDHPDVMPALIQAVGEKKVNTLIGTALEIAGRPSVKDGGYFQDANRTIKNTINSLGGKFASSVIWGNMSATIRQLEAIPEVFNVLGPKAIPHFISTNWTYLTNLDKIHGLVNSAAELDPNLQRYIDGVNDNTASIVDDLVPKKGQKIEKSLIGRGYEMAKTVGFLPHQAADAYLKSVFAHTVMKYVMAGDHPNYPLSKIESMTDQEQFETVQSVVQQMSTLTQIQNREELKAPIQKNIAMKPYTYFWNYPRNVLNNTIIDARRARWKSDDAWENMSEGNYKDAAKDFGGAAGIALSRIVWNTVGAMIAATAAGKALDLGKKAIDWADPKEVEDKAMAVWKYMMESNFERTVAVTPVISSIAYAIGKKKKYQMAEVQDPHGQALSSIATCLPAIEDLLSLSRHPSRMQIRACLESESYVFVSLPVRGYLKAVNWMDQNRIGNSDVSPNFKAQFNTAQVDSFERNVDKFVKDPGNAPKALVAQADALHKQLRPDTVNIPSDANDVIKMAESGGQWSKENGLYGFRSSDWEELRHSAPELGLTKNGRISKDTTQQEKAMDWSLHNDASQLSEKDIPVNTATLYGSHILGVTNYEKLFNAPADAKVKSVLSDADLAGRPELQSFKTIGQVKSYLAKQVENGHNALTSKTSQNED